MFINRVDLGDHLNLGIDIRYIPNYLIGVTNRYTENTGSLFIDIDGKENLKRAMGIFNLLMFKTNALILYESSNGYHIVDFSIDKMEDVKRRYNTLWNTFYDVIDGKHLGILHLKNYSVLRLSKKNTEQYYKPKLQMIGGKNRYAKHEPGLDHIYNWDLFSVYCRFIPEMKNHIGDIVGKIHPNNRRFMPNKKLLYHYYFSEGF